MHAASIGHAHRESDVRCRGAISFKRSQELCGSAHSRKTLRLFLEVSMMTYRAVAVLVADEVGGLALLVGASEELATAEADDAPVVPDVHMSAFGLILINN